MTIIPPYLRKGDTIGIVCPSGYMPIELTTTCVDILQKWGYKVKKGSTLGHQFNYFSGTDQQRLEDLQQMMDDDNVHAIFCARGGYGLTRIIDKLDFKKFRKKAKWIIGYSDITVLHSHLFSKYKIASLHSPMAAAFNDDEYKNEYVQALKKVLAGKSPVYKVQPHEYNKTGKATGQLVGGNLSLLAHLTGTPSDIKTKGRILFIEDIGEYIYHVDRLLYQLKRSGKFDNLAGFIIGSFTDMKDTVVPFGKDIYETIFDAIKEYDIPVCFHFPVGHSNENYPLKVGVEYTLDISNKSVRLYQPEQ
jgi:muramoyltetrapeptide carboxypeptidase